MWLNVDFKNLRNYHLLNKKYYIIYKKLITLYKTTKIREEVTNKTAPSIINFLKLFLFFFLSSFLPHVAMDWWLSSWLLSGTIMAKYVLTGPGHSHLGLGGPRRCGGKWCLFAFAFVLEIRKSMFVFLPADPCTCTVYLENLQMYDS